MDVKAALLTTHVKEVRTYAIAGAPITTLNYRQFSMLPSFAEVHFIDGGFSSMRISGRVIKKDGTFGLKSGLDSYWSLDAVPEWALPLASYESTDGTAP